MPQTQLILSPQQGETLLKLARKTLMEQLGRKPTGALWDQLDKQLQDPDLKVSRGTFVTLKSGGRLRGCIGTLKAREPLAESVKNNTVNAGFHDPRFRAIGPGELDTITIEVSILTPPEPLAYSDPAELITRLRPGSDGVTIRLGQASATFLPQVWEQLPTPESFLSNLCIKAGLSPQAWRERHLSVEIYQVQRFEETR